jgi:uncharacterized protein involved in exopolysaccharide biosynthesis
MNQSPSYEPQRSFQDDAISLVDLAKILIRRWKTLVFVFLVVVFGALAYVLLSERTYEYVSIYQVAEQAPGNALETPSSVLAKVNNLYIGSETRNLREAAGLERLPFQVMGTNPNDTLLVLLSSEASKADNELVIQMHEALLARMTENQTNRVEKHQASLEQQLQIAERSLAAVEQSTSERSGELIASYSERIADIEERIFQLTDGEVVQVSVQSLEPTGTGGLLIMVFALVLGGMLAFIAAFLFEFASHVRQSIKEEKKGTS